MKEDQSIEFKENWNDEYLTTIAGMANASGGKLYIGINDDGDVLGIHNANILLREIPNKVKSLLNILVDINLLYEDNKEYLEIVVKSA